MSTREQRSTLVAQASHSALLEGLLTSHELSEDSDDYIAGEITADELVEMTRARFGLLGSR